MPLDTEQFSKLVGKLRLDHLPCHSYVLHSSPSQRCFELAKALSDQPICLNELIREMNFGTWEGQPWDQIPRQELDQWAGDIFNYSPPQGESFKNLCLRVINFLDSLDNHSSHLVVTHAGVIKALNFLLENKPDAPLAEIAHAKPFLFDLTGTCFVSLKDRLPT